MAASSQISGVAVSKATVAATFRTLARSVVIRARVAGLISFAVASAVTGSAATITFGSLRRHDQLQKFLRIVEELVRFFLAHAYGVRRDLCRDRGTRNRGVGRNEAHFINVNVRITL